VRWKYGTTVDHWYVLLNCQSHQIHVGSSTQQTSCHVAVSLTCFAVRQYSTECNHRLVLTSPLWIKFLMQPRNPSRMAWRGYSASGFMRPPSCRGRMTLTCSASPGVSPTASHGRRSSLQASSVSTTVAEWQLSIISRMCWTHQSTDQSITSEW